jgi:hypothetical protein
MPSLVTCISHLLPAQCVESHVLEARDLGLQEAEIDERRPAVVLPLDVGHGRTLDAEDGQPSAVHPSDLDVA